MCIECYETAGSPKIINERTTRAAELIEEVYAWHCTGGNAHIVLDDWNLDDGFIDWCLGEVSKADDEPEQLLAEREALTALRELSEDERYSALAIHKGILK